MTNVVAKAKYKVPPVSPVVERKSCGKTPKSMSSLNVECPMDTTLYVHVEIFTKYRIIECRNWKATAMNIPIIYPAMCGCRFKQYPTNCLHGTEMISGWKWISLYAR